MTALNTVFIGASQGWSSVSGRRADMASDLAKCGGGAADRKTSIYPSGYERTIHAAKRNLSSSLSTIVTSASQHVLNDAFWLYARNMEARDCLTATRDQMIRKAFFAQINAVDR